jgi:hypothetical protein
MASPFADVRATTPPSCPRPGLLERLRDGLVAVFVGFIAQLLIAGIQLGLNQEKSEFPAPILAMVGVFLLFSGTGCALPGLEDFYRKRLKRAVGTIPWTSH